jgi:hypothetical protein
VTGGAGPGLPRRDDLLGLLAVSALTSAFAVLGVISNGRHVGHVRLVETWLAPV